MKERPVRSIVRSLGGLSRRWLDRRDVFRKKAVAHLTHRSGFSSGMAEAMLDALFRELTGPKLWALLKGEFGDPRVLDGFRRRPAAKRYVRAQGPGLFVHVFSSNIPNAAVVSFVSGMLLKSRNVGKLSSRDAGFLPIYLDSLKRADRGLWKDNSLIDPGDQAALSRHLKAADAVAVYGSDAGIAEIRKRVPASTPFFAYGHRVSFGLYFKEVLDAKALAKACARDVWMADQRGCLSPTAVYAQKGGRTSPALFAERVAAELERLQKADAPLPRRDAAARAGAYSLRARHLVEKIKGKRAGFWESSPRGFWSVSYDEDLGLPLAGRSQSVFIKPFDSFARVVAAGLRPARRYLQSAALECSPHRRKSVSQDLARLGVNRICRAGSMQAPPVDWHHDGKPALALWARWTDWECDKMHP